MARAEESDSHCIAIAIKTVNNVAVFRRRLVALFFALKVHSISVMAYMADSKVLFMFPFASPGA